LLAVPDSLRLVLRYQWLEYLPQFVLLLSQPYQL
jgi:hypothetical protein